MFILVVEDEVLIRMELAEILVGAGLCVVQAGNADEAWAYVEAHGPPALLFSDIQMPGSRDGNALARLLQEHHPHVKVILSSGHVRPTGDLAHLPFLKKPYTPKEARSLILETLGPAARSTAPWKKTPSSSSSERS